MKKTAGIFGGLAGIIFGCSIVYKVERDKLKKWEELNSKNDAIINLYKKWMKIKQDGKSISEYFEENGYHSIAIYGMHYLGETLLKELESSSVKVEYAIDQNANNIDSDIDILTLDDNLKCVDAIIVTAFTFFDEIESALLDIVDCPIISLKTIIDEISR